MARAYLELFAGGAACALDLMGGRYVALVLGERMDDAPWSVALGSVQVVVHHG